MIHCYVTLALLLLGSTLPPSATAADAPSFAALDQQMSGEIKPFLKMYCLECHNADKMEGDLDLSRFDTVQAARQNPTVWEKLLDQVALGEMPPDDAPQPTADEKNALMQWARAFLEAEGRATAGDPGRVVMRRLNNAEYTFTIRDLTGAPLDPAREFPIDGAAGEGFVNVGEALSMSPALFDKYLAAAKDIASHAVLLPDGFRFSPDDRRGDWADDVMAKIRALYARHTEAAGGTAINLQGIQFDTNTGGRLPVAAYLDASAADRDALQAGRLSPEAAARARGLNPKYFSLLWDALNQPSPSSLLAKVIDPWRTGPPSEAAAEIARWQPALTRFQTVGHVKPWMVPVNPLQPRQEVRLKLPTATPAAEVVIHLASSDAGDGSENDITLWENPRLVIPGQPDMPLRNVRPWVASLIERRQNAFASTAACLAAAAQAAAAETPPDRAALAAQFGVAPASLSAWFDCLGLTEQTSVALDYLTGKLDPAATQPWVKGWGSPETPSVVANASQEEVHIPGHLKGQGIAVHPSPTLAVGVGWQSPLTGTIHLNATVTHAHPECGNGVSWAVEWRRGRTRQQLAAGTAQGGSPVVVPAIENLAVRAGDLVSLIVGPRDGNHACDLTDLDFTLQESGGAGRTWSLTADVANDLLAGNPHADRLGNEKIWHFYTEPADRSGSSHPIIPAGSLLARWQAATTDAEHQPLAIALQNLLTNTTPADVGSPDASLLQLLSSLRGPLLAGATAAPLAPTTATTPQTSWGVDPAAFTQEGNLRQEGPASLAIVLPSELVADCELVTSATIERAEGSVQIHASVNPPPPAAGLRPDSPIIVNEGSRARSRFESAFHEFRSLFPAALCYPKIIPVDEVITLTVYHREDENLVRLMLDETETAELNRLWEELHYIGQDALTMVDAHAQLLEYASQDSDPSLFFHLREPLAKRAADFQQQLTASEPLHLDQLLRFASTAYRRPATPEETDQLRALYRTLRAQDMAHEEAFRLTLARVLVAPAFLYRIEQPANGAEAQPVSDWELASRLSYFLGSTTPDSTLQGHAAAGTLHLPATLKAEARRLLASPHARALATEFACQWLHLRGFDQLDEKSDRHFPTFAALRSDMYEETIRFFTDLFQNDGSVLGILNADHTFLNEALAAHYGIPGVQGPGWHRVEGMHAHGRGGVLGMAAMLAKQSGASRTSPILRGNWLVEVLLGDKLPKPPKGVPPLPENEDEGTLSMRQITERHSADPKCSGCHARIDAYGFALENFDAIGRLRDIDPGGRPVVTAVTLPNGTAVDGARGLRDHLATARQEEFLRSFCRKFLGYALGRALKLSDQPLVTTMMQALHSNNYRFTAALDCLLESPQFLRQRGLEATREEEIR